MASEKKHYRLTHLFVLFIGLVYVDPLLYRSLYQYLFRGQLYSKFSFGEEYRRTFGRKFSFTATRERSSKT